MLPTGSVNYRELEREKPKAPTHESSAGVVDAHQQSERVVVRANSQLCLFDVWAKRQNGLEDCETFPLGNRVPLFHVCQGARQIADCRPVGRIPVILLLKECHADLICRGVCVKKERSMRNRKCQDGRRHQAQLKYFEGLSLFSRGIVTS